MFYFPGTSHPLVKHSWVCAACLRPALIQELLGECDVPGKLIQSLSRLVLSKNREEGYSSMIGCQGRRRTCIFRVNSTAAFQLAYPTRNLENLTVRDEEES